MNNSKYQVENHFRTWVNYIWTFAVATHAPIALSILWALGTTGIGAEFDSLGVYTWGIKYQLDAAFCYAVFLIFLNLECKSNAFFVSIMSVLAYSVLVFALLIARSEGGLIWWHG